MANLNKVFLIGNLTRDPELRQLPSGSALCSFGMAINRTMTLASGEQREEVCYVDLVAIGRQAEVIHQYVRKGAPLFVEGRLHYEQWDDRETGKKRSRLTIRVERSQFLGGGGGGGGGGQQFQQQGQGGGGAAAYAGQAGTANQGYAAARPSQQAPPSFAPPPAYGGNTPPAYGAPAQSSMPVFKPLPETAPPANEPPAMENPESTGEVIDDIPF